MIEWKTEEKKMEASKRAQLLAIIMNAPHFTRDDKRQWVENDFLPEDMKKELSPEEIEKAWLAYCE
jgi:hypothetical protein